MPTTNKSCARRRLEPRRRARDALAHQRRARRQLRCRPPRGRTLAPALTPHPAISWLTCSLRSAESAPRGCAAATGQLGLDVEIPGSLTVGGTEVKVDDTVLYSVREDGLFDTLSGTGFAMTDMPGCAGARVEPRTFGPLAFDFTPTPLPLPARA